MQRKTISFFIDFCNYIIIELNALQKWNDDKTLILLFFEQKFFFDLLFTNGNSFHRYASANRCQNIYLLCEKKCVLPTELRLSTNVSSLNNHVGHENSRTLDFRFFMAKYGIHKKWFLSENNKK